MILIKPVNDWSITLKLLILRERRTPFAIICLMIIKQQEIIIRILADENSKLFIIPIVVVLTITISVIIVASAIPNVSNPA